MVQYEQQQKSEATERSRASSGWWTPERLKQAGLAAIVGGAMFITGTAILDLVGGTVATPGTTSYLTAWTLFGLGGLSLFLSSIGAHLRYGDSYGRLGLVGGTVASLAFVSMAVGAVVNLPYAGPANGTLPGGGFAFVGIVVAALGSAILGIGLWRAGLARIAAALSVVAPVLLVLALVVGETVSTTLGTDIDVVWELFVVSLGLAWVTLGQHMRTSTESITSKTRTHAA